MTTRFQRAAIPLGLAAVSYVLAFAQRPGTATSDTKIDLHVDPLRFLAEVASPWSDSIGLGAVWSGQYSGYLWPMGPFFALGDLPGLPAWVVHRLWLGTVLFLAAWGTVRLVDELLTRNRGVVHLVAGACAVLNPYVVVYVNRTSITLLAYAALPWLLVATRRGLASPRSLWWPAGFALIVASAAGGVNAASLGWILVGPLLLVAYELAVLRTPFAAARDFLLRAGALSLLLSAWWIAPTVVHARYGLDFLPFTEQPSAIWHTTSLSESLRGLGFWLSYSDLDFGAGSVPIFSDAGTFLFARPVVVASLALPAFAFLGFLAGRRRPYVPFLLGMVVVGALAMSAGFPEGAPLRRALTSLYEGVQPLQFMRTTYKAGPLVMIGVAVLAGLAVDAVWRRSGTRARVATVAAVSVLLALAAWPLTNGQAIDEQVTFDYPEAWERAAADLDDTVRDRGRALVLPGSMFGFHDWGGTTDPALEPLMEEPSAVRFVVPHSDPRAVELLWTVDGLVQEGRAYPGQLPPLLDLLGAAAVVAPFDYDPKRAGTVPPAEAVRALAAGGLDSPVEDYGPLRTRRAGAASLDGPAPLPTLRRFDAGGEPGLVRLRSRDGATVVDGSAGGVLGLAAFGERPGPGPLLYAADRSAAELRALARRGAHVVISDSNRRRAFQNTRLRASAGRTLDAGASFGRGGVGLDPFGRGPDTQTVATYAGARWVRGNPDVNFDRFPERRPFLAFDGDEDSAWVVSSFLGAGEKPYVEIGFDRPRDIETLELLPYGDSRGRPVEVEIAGRRHELRDGPNTLRVGLEDLSELRIEIARSVAPEREGGPGGIREVRIPGVSVEERLRSPLLLARALRGQPLDRSRLTVLLERTTSWLPWRRGPAGNELQRRDGRDREDAEERIRREVELPAARRFRADAWVSPGFATPDRVLDRLAGLPETARFSSSPRYEGVPRVRAARAFDGAPGDGWIGTWQPGLPAWLEWSSPAPARVAELRLERPAASVRVPTRVRLRHDGATSGVLEVSAGRRVRLPRPVTARRFRLEIVEAAFPSDVPDELRTRRAVGIGELSGPGIPRVSVPGDGAVRGRCGDATLRVGGVSVPLRPEGGIAELEAGGPLRARGCRAASLPAGRHPIVSSGPLRTDLARLDSAAPSPPPASRPGRVVNPGDQDDGSLTGVKLDLSGPGWLVLRESYNPGWRLSCDGTDLGEPVPVDGFANGWPVERCRTAEFRFAPGAAMPWIWALTVLAALALVALLVARRAPAAPEPRAALAEEPEPAGWPLPKAALAGLVAAPILGFVFALRAGVVLGPFLAFVLWRGLTARTLAAVGAVLLGVVVPILYMTGLPEDRGGFNSSYGTDLMEAHWITVLALMCGALAVWRASAALRAAAGGPRRRGAPTAASSAAPAAPGSGSSRSRRTRT